MVEIREQFKKFITDPEWHLVEDLIRSYIEPLKAMESVDLSQEAETVKAEIKVRIDYYNKLNKFLNEVGLLRDISERNTPSFK